MLARTSPGLEHARLRACVSLRWQAVSAPPQNTAHAFSVKGTRSRPCLFWQAAPAQPHAGLPAARPTHVAAGSRRRAGSRPDRRSVAWAHRRNTPQPRHLSGLQRSGPRPAATPMTRVAAAMPQGRLVCVRRLLLDDAKQFDVKDEHALRSAGLALVGERFGDPEARLLAFDHQL